jgi:hypothetical protein
MHNARPEVGTRKATADAIGLHERASATPTGSEQKQPGLSGCAPSLPEGALSLRLQQEWFLAIVSTPESEAAPVDARSAERLVTASKTLSALERLEIYRTSYHARLIECLADDYPVLQHALGQPAFQQLCRAYIAKTPSAAPSLNYFGRHMAEFCRSQPLPDPGFAIDLARLEWAVVLGIHAPTALSIGFDDLGRVPPERWPMARLAVNPSLSILRLSYPVNAYLQSFRQGEAPVLPSALANSVAVYRTGRSVWRLELEPTLETLLESLAGGGTLQAALERVQAVLTGRTEQEIALSVSTCFRHAVSSGLFTGLTLG